MTPPHEQIGALRYQLDQLRATLDTIARLADHDEQDSTDPHCLVRRLRRIHDEATFEMGLAESGEVRR